MNYYPHHIGDFDRATRHLTRIERSIYRDLLDVYYDTEKQLTLDLNFLSRKILARSPEEMDAMRTVLAEFFHETPSGWYHDRCEAELDAYHKTTTQKSIAGKASAAARAAKREQAINGNSTAVERTLNGSPTNQEPLTINHKPEEKVQPIVPPDGATSGLHEQSDRRKQPRNLDPSGTEAVEEVFYYWQQKMGHPQAKLDAKRRKAISGRLKDGYTTGDLCRAIDGCKLSPHHMGQNDRQTVYDDIELICRDGSRVDAFIARVRIGVPTMSPGLQQQVDILQDWMSGESNGN